MPQALDALPLLGGLAQPLEQMAGGLVGGITQGIGGSLGSDVVQGFSQAFQGFGNVLENMGNFLGGGGGNGISSSPMPFSSMGGNFGGGYGGGIGSAPGGGDLSQIGSSLNNMQSQATQLMQSSNPSDQLEGQQMMQQEQMIFDAISKYIQMQGEDAKTAIQAIQ
jgi:hypothetical protein